jgi:glycosyltransferase involved in cell wall biosynthesis
LILIVDFGASQNHTHHKESIFSFAELIIRSGSDFEVWIPAGSEITESNLPIKYNLLPGFNPIGLSLTRPSTWIPALHGKMHNISNKKDLKTSLKFLAVVNSLHFYCLLFKKKLYYKKIKVIFTTVCAFSFKSLYLLEAGKIEIEAYCRLTNTTERRGKLSEIIKYKDFIENSKTFTYVKVFFGTETNAYLEKIGLDNDSRGFISKFPSRQKIKYKDINTSQITISFLGYPTRHKGQQHILPILNAVSKNKPDITWQIQLFENDQLIPRITENSGTTKIFEGKISSQSMDNALLTTTLMCLPYDAEAFKYNASAMMYQSTDYLVPVLTFAGCAFAEEVEKFECGLVAIDQNDMITKISNLDLNLINNWIEGCKKYNDYRNKSNYIFLDILTH